MTLTHLNPQRLALPDSSSITYLFLLFPCSLTSLVLSFFPTPIMKCISQNGPNFIQQRPTCHVYLLIPLSNWVVFANSWVTVHTVPIPTFLLFRSGNPSICQSGSDERARDADPRVIIRAATYPVSASPTPQRSLAALAPFFEPTSNTSSSSSRTSLSQVLTRFLRHIHLNIYEFFEAN